MAHPEADPTYIDDREDVYEAYAETAGLSDAELGTRARQAYQRIFTRAPLELSPGG